MSFMPPAVHPQPHAPAPQGPSPLVALLMHHAQSAPPPAMHAGGAPQAPGAALPLGAGGHAAPKMGHAPTVMPGM